MNEVAIVCFFGIILIFLFSIYSILFNKSQDMFAKWKLGILLIIISSICFFVFFIISLGEASINQTISDGSVVYTIESNNYIQSFNLLPLISAVYLLQWVLFMYELFYAFSFFGRERMKFE